MNVRKLIIAILGLSCFPSPSLPWNDTFIANFILKLYPVLKVQGNIWFLSQLMTTQHTEHLDRFIKRIQDGSGEAQYVWTNRSDVRIIRTASKRNSVAFVLTTGPDDPIMHVHSRVMTGRHFYFSVFIYVPKVHDFREIERLAHLLYLDSFANSMVYYQQPNGQNELAGTEQFPHFQMINLTDFTVYVRRQFQKVMSANQDVAGYKFYTPLRQDLPHVIKYHDKMGRLQLQGTTFRILEDFIDSLNGSIAEYEMPRDNYGYEVVNMKEVLDLVRSRKIDLAAHAYALYHTDDDLDKSYPIMVVKWCLMVPLQNSISTFLYILQPFGWKVWCILLLVFSGLLLLDFLRIFLDSSIFKELKMKFPSQLSDAWLEDFCHIICITAPRAIKVASLKRFLYYATLFYFSFFLSANYTSYLGSFLTVSLFRAQINTMEDLIQAQLPVMIIDYELEFLLSEGFHMPEEFGKLIRPVDSHTFVAHQIQFNKSYAYFVTDDTWHFLDEAQKHLKQKVFKFSDICFGSYHLAYPIQMDSAVWRDLEYFLFRTHSNGLLQKYQHETFQYAVAAGFIKRLAETQEHSSAGLEHLRLLFIIWGLLCGMGLFCLVIEICIHKYRHYKILKF